MSALTIDQIETLLNRGDYVNLAPDGTVTIAPRFGLKAELEKLRTSHEMVTTELNALRALLNIPETISRERLSHPSRLATRKRLSGTGIKP